MGLFGKGKAKVSSTEPVERTLYQTLNQSVKNIAKLKLSQDAGPEELYHQRVQEHQFLDSIVTNLCQIEFTPEFESREHPELLIEELRGILQNTLYVDFLNYHGNLDISRKKPANWDEFQKNTILVCNFAQSLKKCLDFYLDSCRIERDKLKKISQMYGGVLPLEVGNPDDASLLVATSKKVLGESFDYSSLMLFRGKLENIVLDRSNQDEVFKEKTKPINHQLNPSILDAYKLVDSCVKDLRLAVNYLLARRPLFNIYELTSTEDYRRLKWAHENLHRLKPESAEHYLWFIGEHRVGYKKKLEDLRLDSQTFPEDVVGTADIDLMKEKLRNLKERAPVKVEGHTNSFKKHQETQRIREEKNNTR